MFNTSELDELFWILNSIKGFKLRQPQWSNTTLEPSQSILVYIYTISMASNKTIGENSNTSRSDNYSETNDEVQVNPMVLLVRIEHIDGRPIEPDILTETTFRELCQFANPNHEPFAIEILSPHEVCIKQIIFVKERQLELNRDLIKQLNVQN